MGLAAGYALGIAALYIYLFAMPYDAEGAFQDVIKGMLSLAGSYILYLSSYWMGPSRRSSGSISG